MVVDGEWIAETVIKRYKNLNVSPAHQNWFESWEIKGETQNQPWKWGDRLI